MDNKDKQILRELAKKYAEIAALPVQKERRDRARDINDLKVRRPIVWLGEIPWHEMDIDGKLALQCEDEFAQKMENFFRQTLYSWEYIQADMVVDPVYYIPKTHTIGSMGLDVKAHTQITDSANHIISHNFIDQLDTMEKVEALTEPVVTVDTALDKQLFEKASDILDGILPVEMRGYFVYHPPWDKIPYYRGVIPVLMDLLDDPDLMHRTIQRFTDFGLSVMNQMEALQLLDSNVADLHCTPGYVSGLAPKEGGQTTLKNVWIRGMAQIFTEVSPAMWDDFELQYAKPLFEKCGLVYYGCCESMLGKYDSLKTIPNLRKIGVPLKTDPEANAEQIGKDYVYAHKPLPAAVAGTFDREAVRNEIKKVIEACKKNGCPYEFVLKDISTVGYKPQNLINWVKTTMEVVDEYY
ncbi:MAG: hypothetical protein FWC13_03085 [Oscillospiraceae bacterium]|nr:hypothetical protein [Oscillospiraceae bacterium]